MLDTLSPRYRHLLIQLGIVLLTFVGQEYVPVLEGKGAIYAGLVALAVQQTLLELTKLNTQYGVGSDDGPVV